MKGSVVTIGTFDGVHLGHKKILEDVIKNARENGLFSSVIIMERPVSLAFFITFRTVRFRQTDFFIRSRFNRTRP